MSASDVKWVRLGNCIEEYKEALGSQNSISVSGVHMEKGFISTVADMTEVDTSKYKVVPKGFFACNLMHIGRDVTFPLAFNDSEESKAVSPAYYIFHIRQEKRENILSEYLYILLKRAEFGRLTWFHTDSSIRGNLPINELLNIQIPLPDITIQKELVAAYNGLKQLAEENEALIEPLQNACQAYVADCMAKYPMKKLGDQIESFDKRNSTGSNYPFMGINKDKAFMPSFADTSNLDRSKYKVISKGEFVFSGMQTGRDICIRIGLYNEDSPSLLSPAYTTFSVINKDLMPEYLFLQFNRYEMDRYGAFLSDGSIRSNLDWDRFCDIKIPFPPLTVQKAAVDIYNCLEEAKKISSEAREQLKTLCPALVQRASKK